MPYYIAQRKRTYIESVRIYAPTKKKANVMMEENKGQVLETSTESSVLVISRTTVFDIDAEQRCKELFEQEQSSKDKYNHEQFDRVQKDKSRGI